MSFRAFYKLVLTFRMHSRGQWLINPNYSPCTRALAMAVGRGFDDAACAQKLKECAQREKRRGRLAALTCSVWVHLGKRLGLPIDRHSGQMPAGRQSVSSDRKWVSLTF